jgi:ATP-dependent Lon protease
MYTGKWQLEYNYKKGDITYDIIGKRYYICILNHVSDNVTYPTKGDIYWVMINNMFLEDYVKPNAHAHGPLLSPFTGNAETQQRTTDISDTEGSIQILRRDPKKRSLKRRLDNVEDEIRDHKRKKAENSMLDLKDQLLLMDIDLDTKAFIMDKYHSVRKMSGSDYSKGMTWLKLVASLPYGVYKRMKISKEDSQDKIKDYLAGVKKELDRNIYGLEAAKQEILEFVARKITNPEGKGDVIALCGEAGVGKTKLIHSLARALDLPFQQINCGGLNDVAVLTGHSETYVGSKPGKIVEALQGASCMNPIFYFDEIDKISEQKNREIFGILTHLYDEEQNHSFQDNYLANVKIDLSKCLFAISFNDITKVDEIVCDRMKVIYINTPSMEDKIRICQEKMLPEIIKSIKFMENVQVQFDKEVIAYLISKHCKSESGVRQLKKLMEKILNRLNYDILVGHDSLKVEKKGNVLNYNITTSYINQCLPANEENESFSHMYL